MKVKCVNIYNEHTKQYEEKSVWLTIGKEYVVLGIYVRFGKDILYRLSSDQPSGLPALFNSKQFKIVSNLVPTNWKVYNCDEDIGFCPEAWQKPGFLEDLFDGDPEALAIFKAEAKIIVEQEENS